MKHHSKQRRRGYLILAREDGKWLLTRDGTPSKSYVYATVSEAVEAGRKLARNERVSLKVLTGKTAHRRSRERSIRAGGDRAGDATPKRSHGTSEEN